MRKHENVFERTAKFGIEKQKQKWTQKQYQLRFDAIVYPEIGLGIYSFYAAYLASQLQSWGIVLYALLFGIGLIFVAGVTVVQATAVYRDRKARTAQAQAEGEWSGHAQAKSSPIL